MDWNILDCTVLADTKKALPSIRLVPSNMITWHDSVENKAYYKTAKQYHLVGNLVGLISARDIYTVGFLGAICVVHSVGFCGPAPAAAELLQLCRRD